jgi:hypothetical protein
MEIEPGSNFSPSELPDPETGLTKDQEDKLFAAAKVLGKEWAPTFKNEVVLNKSDFLAHCLWRNPLFRSDIVKFWQKLPPVLAITDLWYESDEAEDQEHRFGLNRTIWKPKGERHFVGTVKTYKDLSEAMAYIQFDLDDSRRGYEVLNLYADAKRYEELTGVSPAQRDKAILSFRHRWPLWSAGRLLNPHAVRVWDVRPGLLTTPESYASLGRSLRKSVQPLEGDSSNHLASLWIPVYEDTRAEDIDWKQIAELQSALYGKKRRGKSEEKYELLLKIWDWHEEGLSIPEIARKLRRAVSTVRSNFAVVQSVVCRIQSPELAAEALDHPVALIGNIEECPECRHLREKGLLCRLHEEYVNSDHVSQRALQGGDLERTLHGQARQLGVRPRRVDPEDERSFHGHASREIVGPPGRQSTEVERQQFYGKQRK